MDGRLAPDGKRWAKPKILKKGGRRRSQSDMAKRAKGKKKEADRVGLG
jgi:hypothetical protein